MKKLSLLLGLAAVVTSVGCGSGNGSFGPPGPGGNFSNSSLNGQYAYQMSGFDFTSVTSGVQFSEAGVFTADGNGHITTGWNDLGETSNVVSGPISGTYAVDADGTGNATLNFSGGTINMALTLVSASKLYLTTLGFGGASNATGAGVAEKQTTSTFSAAPAGTFAFRLHTVGSVQGPSSIVGAFNVSGGVVGTGNEDIFRGTTFNSETLTGSFNAPDSTNGRGTGTLTTGLGATSTFAYYLVDGNSFLLFSDDTGSPGLGRAEKQSMASFSATSLSGSYAFGSRGDTTNVILGSRTVGRFTAGGDGTITAGTFDSVQDGTPSTNVPFTGTYTVTPNGRAVVDLLPTSGSPIQHIFWLVSPSRAFFAINDASKFEDGTIDLQQSSSFSNTSLNGTFAFVTDGFDNLGDFNQIGTLTADGSGNLSLRYLLSPSSSQSVLTPTGTYSVASSGRATASVNNLSNNLVFYLISGSDAYILQDDTNTEVDGQMSKQP